MIVRGEFYVECYSPGGVLLWSERVKNTGTKVGRNHLLDAGLNNTGGTANWFIGIISGTSFTEVSPDDTSASHAGWTEFTSYTSATRPAWGQGAASGQMVTNATSVTFTYNASGSIKGLFAISNSTKGGNTGILLATAELSSSRSVFSGTAWPVTYRVQMAAGEE